MKVLLINTSENTGGAAIAARRLLMALRKNGADAEMLVRDRSGVNDHVRSVLKNDSDSCRAKWYFYRERLNIFLHNGFNRENLFAVSTADSGFSITDLPEVRDADIIHLHWINQGFISLDEIRKLSAMGKKIVWTMHDMWSVTGICHHARTCTRYTSGCMACPFLNSKKEDLSTIVFNRKKEIYKLADPVFITCSKWLKGLAQQSLLTAGSRVVQIPNPIDTTRFFPLASAHGHRAQFNLPDNKHLILFGALNVTDKRKGIDYLLQALEILALERKDIELVVFGRIKAELKEKLPFKVHAVGYLTQEEDIFALYNSVDIYVTPSLEENLPNTIMEAMACGKPCVGFNIGGIPEMIDHKINGYVARYKSAADLAQGINWVLDPENYKTCAHFSRDKVETSYSEAVVAGQYLEIYKDVLNK
ncbi:MAG: glycosyltransferase family 4 protein [Bacteroidales bacterium]